MGDDVHERARLVRKW